MEPALLNRLLDDFLMPAWMGTILREVPYAPQLLPLLRKSALQQESLMKNPLLKDRLTEWASERPADDPNLADHLLVRTVGLLGRQATRNALMLARLKQIGGPNEQLVYSIQAEELCQNLGLPFSDEAFAAGIHYDWMRALLVKNKSAPEARGMLEPLWKEAILAARIAHNLGTQIGSLEFDRFAFGAALVAPLGRPLAAALLPKSLGPKSWGNLNTECEKLGKNRDFAFELREMKVLQTSAAELGALFTCFLDLLRPIEAAILYHRRPYCLKRAEPRLYPLAGIVGISWSLVGQKPKGMSVPKGMHGVLKDLRMTEKAACMAAVRVLAKGT